VLCEDVRSTAVCQNIRTCTWDMSCEGAPLLSRSGAALCFAMLRYAAPCCAMLSPTCSRYNQQFCTLHGAADGGKMKGRPALAVNEVGLVKACVNKGR
jgi:hypothetical protein